MATLWYALYKGELCRLRRSSNNGLRSEVWRNGCWKCGPDFSKVDFTGRVIREDEARNWIRSRFRQKSLRKASLRP